MKLTKKEKQKLADHAGLGLKLLKTVYLRLRKEIEEQSGTELDENGELNVRKDFVDEAVIQSEEVTEVMEEIVDLFWDEALDKETYAVRQYLVEQRELERTNRAIDSSIKGPTIRKINKNMRS